MLPDAAVKPLPRGASSSSPSLLSPCSAPGCSTLTMGGTCVEHDAPPVVDFPRGRPYPPTQITSPIASV